VTENRSARFQYGGKTVNTVVITGANRGIGLEFCRQYQARGAQVIALCRQASADLHALNVRIEEGIDVTDSASLEALAARLEGTSIEVLINNAGILRREHLDAMDFDSIRDQFEVNAMGPLRVTHALLSRMTRGSKVAIITSRMGSIADNSSGSRYGYRMSKAAVNMAGKSLALDLSTSDIAVAILHPGFVQTDMTGGHGEVTAAFSAKGLISRIDALSMANTGTFWHAQGQVLPW
jgi:NAD(P)-dependent dehydrogenase (short-subunit alcohol dehydrogenase family)